MTPRFRVFRDAVAGFVDIRIYVRGRLSGSLRMGPEDAAELSRLLGTCPACDCSKGCRWATAGEVDEDAVPCAACGCRWCGPMTAEFMAKQGNGCPGTPLRTIPLG